MGIVEPKLFICEIVHIVRTSIPRFLNAIERVNSSNAALNTYSIDKFVKFFLYTPEMKLSLLVYIFFRIFPYSSLNTDNVNIAQ